MEHVSYGDVYLSRLRLSDSHTHLKGTAKDTSMNVNLYISTLRAQNEYLGQLSAQIGTQLRGIEQTFNERPTSTAAEITDLLAGFAGLHKCLCIEAETLTQRLSLLVEKAKTATDSTVKN